MSRFARTNLFFVPIAVLWLALTPAGMRWLGIFCLLTLYVGVFTLGVAWPGLSFFGPAVCRGRAMEAGPPRVALTFDDGPDPLTTPLLLDELARLGVKAAFFLVGERVRAHPDIARAIVEQGHLVGNHSWKHHWTQNFLTGGPLETELSNTQTIIAQAAGAQPAFYRPPVGLTNPHLFPVLKKLGLRLVAWDVRTFDRQSSPERVVKRVMDKAADGSIVLLHDQGVDSRDLAQIVRGVLEGLDKRGFALARLDEILSSAAAPPTASRGGEPDV